MISSCSLVLSTCGSATMATFSEAITVNGHLVPSELMTAPVVDPHSLCGNMDTHKEMEVDVVDFSFRANVTWLFGPRAPIKKTYSWWRANNKDIPLLKEIREVVKAAGKGEPRKTFVFVQVRNKTLLFANETYRILLALAGHPEAEPGSHEDKTGILAWFLTQLEQDIKKLEDEPERQTQAAPSAEPAADRDVVIREGIKALKGLPAVQRAVWQPSRKTFKIFLKDQRGKEFRAYDAKKRKADAPGGDAEAIKKSLSRAMRWSQGEG